MLNLVLYQPDIPQNLGAILRLSACLGCTVHIIEPCGFPFNAQKLKRVGMDYIHQAKYIRHVNWQAFLDYRQGLDLPHRVAIQGTFETGAATLPSRLFLLETDGKARYTDMHYQPNDYIVLGSESSGTPQALYAQMDATLTIPMRAGMRSLNVAMSAGIVVAEACRQLEWRL